MVAYIVRRSVMLLPILLLISIVSFAIIELPPGDWVTYQIENLRASGIQLNEEEAERLVKMYGFDEPAWQRYIKWMQGILFKFNFGWSFQWGKTVNELLSERLPLTLLISILALIVS